MADISGRQDTDPDVGHEDTVAADGEPPIRVVAGAVAVSVSRSVYSRRVVLAAAYKLSNRWAALVDDVEPGRWILYLVGLPPEDATAGVRALIQELTDQAIRERLDDETRDLRTLIVAQAFSEGNLLDPGRDIDEPPIDTAGAEPHRPV